jgi:phospholipid/cholesterol/gamma-HCH transport system substrate-binding protein
MASRKRNEVLVGAFLFAGAALFVLLLFLMGSLDTLLEGSSHIEADFEDVQGLQAGDPVFLFGVKEGKVRKVALLPAEGEKPATVRVTMQLPRSAFAHLREDSFVKIEKSVTGILSVSIRESVGKRLPEGARLKGTPAADLALITDKLSRLLDEGQKAVATVTRIVDQLEAKGDISSATSDLAGLLKDVRGEILPLRDRLKSAFDLVKEFVDENRLDVRHTLANLKETTDRTRTFADKLSMTPDQISRSLTEIEKAGDAVTTLLSENRADVRDTVKGLADTSSNLSNLSADVKRRPWRLLYRPGTSELKDMDLYDAAWAYNLGASELHRSIRDLTAAIEAGSTPGATKEIEDIKRRVDERLSRQREVEDAFWEKLRADG